MLGGALALVTEDTKSLSFLVQTRGNARALMCAVACLFVVAAIVTGAFLAGGMTPQAARQAVVVRLTPDVKQGLADAALQHVTINAAPDAGALARNMVPIPTAKIWTAKGGAEHAGVVQASAPFRLDGPVSASRDLDCLTAAVYYEARGESPAGQAAVAQVVLNRARHPAFPRTVCGVVFQGAGSHSCQFSFACNGAMRLRHEAAAWERARDVAGRALSGYVMAAVGGATHFHVARLGAVWGGSMMKIAQVGQHIFYGFSGRRSAFRGGAVELSGPAEVTAAAAAPADADLAVVNTLVAQPASAASAASASTVAVATTPVPTTTAAAPAPTVMAGAAP